jgi:hypothetical protein
MLKADFWFSDEMSTDIQSLKNQFPGNAFLDAIRPHMIQVKTESGKKNTMRVIRSRSKAKVSSEREEMIINGLDALLMNPDQEVKEKAYKLFYYSIIKDGLNNAPYSLRRYLNPDYFREISTGMKEIESSFKELIDKPLIDETEFAKMFTTMLQSVTGSSASLQTLINKVISQMNPEAKAEKVNVISFDERGKFKDANKNTQEMFVAALKSIRSDMSLVSKENKERKHPTLVKEGKPVARKFRKGKSSYDLFLPGAGNSFEINFPQIEDAKVRSLRDDILVQMKMFPTRSNGERVWKCPLFVTNSYGEIMILNSIDGVPITERLTNKVYNKAFNTSDEEQLYTNAFVATGSATYVKMELQGNPQISSIAFDEQEAVRLNELYYGEKDAVVTEPVLVTEDTTELIDAPTEPTVQTDKFTIADKLSPIEQNFRDGSGGRQMQTKFAGKSTMDLILSGDRTRTTRSKTEAARYMKDYGLSKVSDLVGKIIRMTDKNGTSVYTEITNVAKFTQEYQDATWQKEGWVKSVTDAHVGQYPYAIEFKVVNKPALNNSIDNVINSKEEQSKDCNKGNK